MQGIFRGNRSTLAHFHIQVLKQVSARDCMCICLSLWLSVCVSVWLWLFLVCVCVCVSLCLWVSVCLCVCAACCVLFFFCVCAVCVCAPCVYVPVGVCVCCVCVLTTDAEESMNMPASTQTVFVTCRYGSMVPFLAFLPQTRFPTTHLPTRKKDVARGDRLGMIISWGSQSALFMSCSNSVTAKC